jgi:DNA-binding transcriptional LysR family regulator
MDMRALRYFIAVYEVGNISAAARRCSISQPSISEAIAGLETELRTDLFVRHRKGVTATEGGRELYARAKRLVDEAEAIRSTFRKEKVSDTLTVGLMRSLDVARSTPLLKQFSLLPGVSVRLVDADERCDIRLVSKAIAAPQEIFIPLWSEQYVVALPPAHHLAKSKTIKMVDLTNEPLIDRCHCEYQLMFDRTGGRPSPVAVAPSEEWALALVKAGIGVAILPEGVARTATDIVTRPLRDIRLTRIVGLAYPKSARANATIRMAIKRLQDLPRSF